MAKNFEDIKSEYNNIPVPPEALSRIQKGIDDAKAETKIIPLIPPRKIAIGIAAAFAVCFLGVNTSATVANAMGSIPVIGAFFKVITVRHYIADNGTASLSVEIPEVSDPENPDNLGADEVNEEIAAYIDELMNNFTKEYEAGGGDYMDLDVSYNVITNNDKYFSLDIHAVETMASGYEFHRFYTIDKEKGQMISLADLFPDKDYVSEISAEILRQMEADSETPYFIGAENDGFEQIDPDQKFYIDPSGDLVICFDEYEVGPGSIGAPIFTIQGILQ